MGSSSSSSGGGVWVSSLTLVTPFFLVNGETYEYVPICGIPDYFKQYNDAQEKALAATSAAGSSANMSFFSTERNSITIDLVDDDDSDDDISVQRKRSWENSAQAPGDHALTNGSRPAKVSRVSGSQIIPSENVVVLIEDSDDDEKPGSHQSSISNGRGGRPSTSHSALMVISDDEEGDPPQLSSSPQIPYKSST